MNISSIKNRANEVLMTNKPEFIRILTILMLVGLIPSLFSGTANVLARFISIAINILFLTFHHGYIVSSLKMVRNNAQALNDDDAFVGFRRFKELFPTYLLTSVVIWAVLAVAIFILVFVVTLFFGTAFSGIDSLISSAAFNGVSAYTILSYIVAYSPSIIFVVLLMFFIIIILAVVVSTFLFAVPYLLEQYNITTMDAIKESFQMMKGHIWDLIKLQLSFFAWIVVIAIVESIIAELLSFIPMLGSMIALIASGFLGIYTYLPQYYLSQAIFFEELAYHRYENKYQYNGEESHV